MKVQWHLDWTKGRRKIFKSDSAQALFQNYTQRLEKYTRLEATGGILQSVSSPNEVLWICEREKKGSKILSSEDLAQELAKVLAKGIKTLHIMVGGPDGFSSQEIVDLKPQLLWSFGKLTLPHELAAVISAEQLYRAFCILKGHPYHSGH